MKKNIYIIWLLEINLLCEGQPVKAYTNKKEAMQEFEYIKEKFKHYSTISYKLQETTIPLRYLNRFTTILFPLGYRKWTRKVEKEFEKTKGDTNVN